MKTQAMIVAIVFCSLLGDYFLKVASVKDKAFLCPEFLAGAVLYAATAVGWIVVMRHMTMATLGIWYSVVTLLLVAGLGAVVFRETLSSREMAGMALACLALGLMGKAA